MQLKCFQRSTFLRTTRRPSPRHVTGGETRTRLPSTLITVPTILVTTLRSLQYQGPGCAAAGEPPARTATAMNAASLVIAKEVR